MNREWDNVKNPPQTAEGGFWKPNCGNWVFGFWILRSVQFGSVFRKPISDIFVVFRTPLCLCVSAAELQQQKKDEELRKKKQEEEKQQRRRLRADDVFSDDDSEDSVSDKKREEKGQSDQDLESAHSQRSSSSSSSSSSAESEVEADLEEDENEKKKAQQIKTMEELSAIRLSRHRLERWCFMPYLKRIVIGCFVRIGIGAHQGKSVYRVSDDLACAVKSVKSSALSRCWLGNRKGIRHVKSPTLVIPKVHFWETRPNLEWLEKNRW